MNTSGKTKNSVNFFYYCIVLLISLSQCGYKLPEKIPTGEWYYMLVVNGVKAGKAKFNNKLVKDEYIFTSELSLKIGDIENISKQIITETKDFKPVKFETYNKIIDNGKTQDINTIASFKGRQVQVTADKQESSFTLDKEFRLEGNYILNKLIENKFKEGLEIKTDIYDPTIELETPISITVKVIGIEEVDMINSTKKLIHITESIENVKSIDTYINEKGIMEKTVIVMLNTVIMIVKE